MAGQPAPRRGRTGGGGSGPLRSARSAGAAGTSGSSCGLAAAAHHGAPGCSGRPRSCHRGPAPAAAATARARPRPPATAGSGSAPSVCPHPPPADQWAPGVEAGCGDGAGGANQHKPGGRRLRLPAEHNRSLSSLDLLKMYFIEFVP